MMIVPIIITIAVIVVLVIVASEKAKKKRQEDIAAFAAGHSLEFQPTAIPESLGIYAPFPLLDKGRSRTITNAVLADTQNTTARMFDYRFTTGGGKSQATHHFSVVYFKSELLKLPEFSLSPENFFHSIGRVFGMQDINFDSHPKFSSAFLLQGANEEEVRNFMTDKRLSELEKYTNICIEASQSRFIIYRNLQVQPKDYSQWLAESFQIFSVLCEAAD
jgi:hypothetical protein